MEVPEEEGEGEGERRGVSSSPKPLRVRELLRLRLRALLLLLLSMSRPVAAPVNPPEYIPPRCNLKWSSRREGKSSYRPRRTGMGVAAAGCAGRAVAPKKPETLNPPLPVREPAELEPSSPRLEEAQRVAAFVAAAEETGAAEPAAAA